MRRAARKTLLTHPAAYSSVENTRPVTRLFEILGKDHRVDVDNIKLPSGKHASTTEEALRYLPSLPAEHRAHSISNMRLLYEQKSRPKNLRG